MNVAALPQTFRVIGTNNCDVRMSEFGFSLDRDEMSVCLPSSLGLWWKWKEKLYLKLLVSFSLVLPGAHTVVLSSCLIYFLKILWFLSFYFIIDFFILAHEDNIVLEAGVLKLVDFKQQAHTFPVLAHWPSVACEICGKARWVQVCAENPHGLSILGSLSQVLC